MDARRNESRAADMIPGINLENPNSPEALWLAATVLQVTSPSRPTDPPAVTPSSAARMLFSPSLKPTVSPAVFTQEHPAQLTLLEQIHYKRAAAAAAAGDSGIGDNLVPCPALVREHTVFAVCSSVDVGEGAAPRGNEPRSPHFPIKDRAESISGKSTTDCVL